MLEVFNKSPDERAETAGLGVFPREPALRWRLWNQVGNRWCADSRSHASYHIRLEDVTLPFASNLCLTQWCGADAGETGLPDGENRSSRSFWALAAITAFFNVGDLPTGRILMELLASPRWPCVRVESLNRLPPVVWWGNAGVFINQPMVGVHKFELSIFYFGIFICQQAASGQLLKCFLKVIRSFRKLEILKYFGFPKTWRGSQS